MDSSHDSSILTPTPKSKRKNRSKVYSPRGGPEGNSMFQKSAHIVQATTSGTKTPVSTKKKKGRHVPPESPDENQSPKTPGKKSKLKKRTLGDSEIDIDELLALDALNASKKSKSSLSSEVSLSTTQATVTPSSSASWLAKQKNKKKTKVDESWEKAVETARGLPDGAIEESNGTDEENESESDGNAKEKKGKGKSKKLNVIQNAAKKLKKITGKNESPTKGQKRKHDESANDSLSKKVKLEELTKKDRKQQRKMSDKKGSYEIAKEAKTLWNELRRFDLTPEKRHETSAALYELVKGKAKEFIFAHDTSRAIQCLLKYGAQEHKNALFEELKENVLEMAKSKYAKFFVRKLMKYGTKGQRNYVFRKFYGNVKKLVRHKEAAEIIEVAYNDYANASQRAALIEEFYGPSFALFKTPEQRSLNEIMKSNPDKRDSILSNMKEALSVLADKTILQFSIVHRVFLEFFTYATDKLRAEMIETLREGVVNMLHTRDGARVAMMCLWHGTPKDRKVIVKSFKTYILKICKEEYGHMTLLAMFDVVDDTKLIQKAVLEELLKSVVEAGADQYGRKVLLYLLSARDPLHFHPDIVKVLQQGDNNVHSKKSPEARRGELLSFVSKPLIQYIAQNCKTLVTNNASLLLLLNIITHTTSDPTAAMRSVAEIAAEPFAQGSLDNMHIVEHPAGHLTLKRLILNDVERIKAEQTVLFSQILLDIVPEGSLKSWAACNRGCFILISLLELNHAEITTKLRNELISVKKSMKKMNFKGAQILLDKLKD